MLVGFKLNFQVKASVSWELDRCCRTHAEDIEKLGVCRLRPYRNAQESNHKHQVVFPTLVVCKLFASVLWPVVHEAKGWRHAMCCAGSVGPTDGTKLAEPLVGIPTKNYTSMHLLEVTIGPSTICNKASLHPLWEEVFPLPGC